MNKNEFLKKLSKLLHMLQEEEVRDILDEYEQHNDMKVAGGMSEEDAIADFGSVEELAEEILDAYHVKADFKKKKVDVVGKVQAESKKVMKNAGEAGKSFWTRCADKMKSVAASCKNGLKKAASNCKRWCLAPFLFLGNLFSKKKEDDSIEKPVKEKKDWGIGKGICAFFRGILRLLKKICYGCLLLCTGLTGIFLILLTGILIVLLVLGYPVIGVTIATIGATMTFNAVAYYAGMKWRRV